MYLPKYMYDFSCDSGEQKTSSLSYFVTFQFKSCCPSCEEYTQGCEIFPLVFPNFNPVISCAKTSCASTLIICRYLLTILIWTLSRKWSSKRNFFIHVHLVPAILQLLLRTSSCTRLSSTSFDNSSLTSSCTRKSSTFFVWKTSLLTSCCTGNLQLHYEPDNLQLLLITSSITSSCIRQSSTSFEQFTLFQPDNLQLLFITSSCTR